MAAKYLEALTVGAILRKLRVGRSNFYIKVALYETFAGKSAREADPVSLITTG